MQQRFAVRYDVHPSPDDGKPVFVFAVGWIVAFRPGLPAPQPAFAVIFLLLLFMAIPEVRGFAVVSIPAGIACGALLYALRKWRRRHFPTPDVTPLGL